MRITRTNPSPSVVILFIIAAPLFGCLSAGEQTALPGDYSQAFLSLDSATILNLSEQAQLTNASINGPVAVANYFPAKNELLAAYSGDGFLRAWDVGDTNILFEHDLGIVSNTGAGLDQSGDLVMGALHHIVKENSPGELTDYIGGITVWNTATGKIIECITYPCDRTAPPEEWELQLIRGATLDPTGRWVLANFGTIIDIIDLTDSKSSYSYAVHDIEDDSYGYMSLFAFDPGNDRYAIAYKDGQVLISKKGIKTNWFLGFYLGKQKEEGRLYEAAALSFSPDGHWLARIQENILTLWAVTIHQGKIKLEHETPDGHLIAFDQSSQILFVGTTEHIEVWDIKEGKLIGEFTTPEITSLSVSADNRLLIWGDQSGVIHVWGIRK